MKRILRLGVALGLVVALLTASVAVAGAQVIMTPAKVTGGGTVDWAERVTYGFTAQMDASGAVKGEAQFLHRDVGYKDHADVLCLVVVGGDAWIGAVITQSDDPSLVGQEIYFRVQDNGEGKKATGPDAVSSVFFGPADTVLSMPDLGLMPWTNGNVQVKSERPLG